MKKVLLVFAIFFLVGCSQAKSEIKFTLEGNITTGYEWTCVDDANIVNIESEYEQKSNLDGAAGIYTIRLTGNKKGSTTVVCTYKRSWEDTEYDKIEKYSVSVDKRLKIKLDK